MGNCIPSQWVGRVRRTRLSAGVPLCGWVARSASTPYLLWVALPFRVARSASKPYLFWGAYLLWVFC